jgi:D-aspartate ligase
MRIRMRDQPSPPVKPQQLFSREPLIVMTAQDMPREDPNDVVRSRVGAGAVILGGAHGSLAVARSLGRHGVPVWFITHDHPIAKYSRYVERSIAWAGPDGERAAEWLVELAARNGLDGWLLFAGGDPEVRLIANHHAALAGVYRVASPPWPVARIACCKQATYEHAAATGVAAPLSFYPRSRDEAAGLACEFPVILKPAVNNGRNAFTAAKAWRVDDRAALLARYEEAVALVGHDAIVVQELIPGGGEAQFSYAAVWNEGKPVASLVARRARQFPVDFGFTSTFVRTVEVPAVEEAACRFLDALDYSGLVEIEFKYDIRDGRYKLLDFNPRTWTWIALGAAAGVDFPLIQWQITQGECSTTRRGRLGAGWCHASRDLLAACQHVARGTLTPVGYAASLRHLVFAAFALDDPLPGIVDVPVVLARLLSRRYYAGDAAPVADVRRPKRCMPVLR